MSTVPTPSEPKAATAAPAMSRSTAGKPLADLPKDELEHLAAEFGLDPRDYRTKHVLGLTLCALGLVSDGTYALVAGAIADRLRRSRAQRWIGGTVLIGL